MSLCLLAGALVHCQTPGAGGQPEQAHSATPEYRSVDDTAEREDATAGGARSAEAAARGASARLKPANHTADWVERHGAVALANSADCTSCHQEEDCASCHTEELSRPFQVHPPNYRTIHARDARLDMNDCVDCHKVETFCAECHARHGVRPRAPHDPPERMQFHPPGWLDSTAPDNHGVAARRNITECASCHQERDCVTCHQGVNPHPPEFRLDCGRMLRADPRPCTQCHGNVQMLKELCL